MAGFRSMEMSIILFNGGGATRDNIVTVDDKKYFISAETGKQHNGWFSIDRVNDKGVSYTTWYYANSDGTLLTDGWKQLGGKWYYFYAGANSPRKAWLTLDNKRVYVDENGVRQENGWFAIFGVNGNGQEYSNWYYADAVGDVLRDGYHEVGGVNYYFDANGLNYRKRWLIDDAVSTMAIQQAVVSFQNTILKKMDQEALVCAMDVTITRANSRKQTVSQNMRHLTCQTLAYAFWTRAEK